MPSNDIAGGSISTGSSSGATGGGVATDGGIYTSALTPPQPGDQFGLAPAVTPSTDQAAVAPAAAATAQPATISATWGETIPYLFGTCQVLGLPLWTGAQTYITGTDGAQNLVIDFAVVFGRPGPNSTAGSIRNIYFDGQPVITFNKRTQQLEVSGDFDYTFYDGQQDESAVDPLIDAQESPNTPAFLGMIYLVVSQFVCNGNNFPQVIGEIHLDEIASPSGGSVEPMATNNTLAPSPGYDTNRGRVWWDSDRYALYCPLPPPYGVHGEVRIDVYDTNAKAFLYSFFVEGSADYFDTDYEISSNGDFMWYINGYTDVYLCSLADGRRVSHYTSPIGGIIQDCNLFKGVGGCNEIAILPTFGRQFEIVERRGASIVHGNNFDFDDIGTGFSISNAMYGCAGVLDYSTMNCDVDGLTIVYCLMQQAGEGYIGRIIYTRNNGDVIAGISYLTDPDTGAHHAEPVLVHSRIDLLAHTTGGVTPSYIWVADNNRRLYVLMDGGDGGSYIYAYDTFYQTNNSEAKPRLSTDTATNFNKCELVYSKRLAGHVGTPRKGSQIRRVGQNKVAVTGAFGQSVITIDLRSGRSKNHVYGDWHGLPALGGFDYGSQYMPSTTIFDPDTGAVFYFNMAGYNDLPGRLFLANPAVATRPKYRVADAFRDLSIMAGYTSDQIDVTGLDGVEEYVTGMALNQGVGYQDLVSQLAAAFRVEITETPNFGIRFRKRHSLIIDAEMYPSDLVTSQGFGGDDGHVIDLNYAATNQVPTILQLAYVDPDQQYLVAISQAKRAIFPHVTVSGKSIVQISIPIVMTHDRADYFAGTALFDMWAGAVQATVTTGPSFIGLEVGDNVNLYFPTGRLLTCKIIGATFNENRSITFVLSAIKTDIYVPQAQITEHRT